MATQLSESPPERRILFADNVRKLNSEAKSASHVQNRVMSAADHVGETVAD